MRAAFISAAALLATAGTQAAPRVDNVLVRMVPPGSTALVGVRMEQVRETPLYRKMMERDQVPGLDQFATDTGFDPRRDVRELLLASTAHGTVLVARGAFKVNQQKLEQAKPVRHGQYTIWTARTGGATQGGLCILDATLAAAGQLEAVEAALDEWTSGTHTAAQPLLARVQQAPPGAQVWGVAAGTAEFLGSHMPGANAGSGLDISTILRGLTDAWFEADLSTGLKAEVHGAAASEKDAVQLRDAAKGAIGFGRLNVPENQPELLRLWDGITVEQLDRAIAIRADIVQNLIDRLVDMMTARRQQ